MDVMGRDRTLEFLRQHVKTEVLMKHLLAVDSVSTLVYNGLGQGTEGGVGMVTVLDKPISRGQRNGKVPIVGKGVIYTRVSTDRQKEEGASLDVQREACLRYCEAHGLLVVGEFTDVQSGLDSDRPQYQRVIELAWAKGFDKLVTWRLDRLGRDSAEYIPLLKGLRRLEIDVVSVTQPTESMFMQQVIGVMAEEESRQISIRTTASKQRRFSEGNWGSAAPFGYRSEKQKEGGSVLVANAEAGLVTAMFTHYASGKYSLADLRDFLNASGYLKSRYAIAYILKNPVYLGLVQHGRFARSQFQPKPAITQAQGKHQPLVDVETFEKVQSRLAMNVHRGRGGMHPKYLFSGLVHCGTCDHKFVGRTKMGHGDKRWVQYECSRRTGFGDCGSHTIFENRITAEVVPLIKQLLSALQQEDIRKAVRGELTSQHEATKAADQGAKESLTETQKRLEGRLSRLEDSYLDGDLPRERYLIRRDEIMGQLKDIQQQLSAKPHLALPDLDQVFAIADSITVDDLDQEAWRDIIEGLINRVVIIGREVTIEWKAEYAPLLASVRAHETEG
jgi:DNA invertase Pin-like site-specific DNA recombinase